MLTLMRLRSQARDTGPGPHSGVAATTHMEKYWEPPP
jgi:hypothetical protein